MQNRFPRLRECHVDRGGRGFFAGTCSDRLSHRRLLVHCVPRLDFRRWLLPAPLEMALLSRMVGRAMELKLYELLGYHPIWGDLP
jgi:hypothetical protein